MSPSIRFSSSSLPCHAPVKVARGLFRGSPKTRFMTSVKLSFYLFRLESILKASSEMVKVLWPMSPSFSVYLSVYLYVPLFAVLLVAVCFLYPV